MAVYAIGDLHLGSKVDKPMSVFGDNWINHKEKIEKSWYSYVEEEDVVLIPGDISWAMSLEDALDDLKWINDLPGKKVLIKGNHDYWWKSVTKLNQLYNNLFFLQNDFYNVEDIAICGTRGWVCPNDNYFFEQDDKIYKREVQRLELSLNKAKQAGFEKLLVMLHYPPTNDKKEPSGFTELIKKYEVSQVVYGHLHGKASFNASLKGDNQGIRYHLVSCDFLKFNLLQVI